jgi:hypothetical protein
MAEINEEKSSKKPKKVSMTTLRSMLKKGVVKFEYKKKDGSIRKAEGTLRKSLIPEIDKDGGAESDFPEDCFGYYDLDKDDWRMFIRDNFIGIISKKNKKEERNGKEK